MASYHGDHRPLTPWKKRLPPNGLKDTLTPNPFTIEEIHKTIGEFKQAAQNAKTAGFDGIEIHGHLFTLIPQFLSSSTNQRNDEYGGSIQNRARLLFEIIDAVKEVYPGNRIGIKFSPVAFNTGMIKPDQLTIPTYEYILDKLNDYHLGYVQLVGPATDLKGTAVEALAHDYFRYFGQIYRGTMIANLGFNQETGNAIIADGHADLVSFGTPFIANPDLVERFDQRLALAQPDRETFYTGGEKGYTDYPRATK
jgi:N-ethylmaleimide reductase